jgi:hypothetical protein
MTDEADPYRPRCKYLTCKSMIVFGEAFASDPDYQAGLTEFWCVQTARGTGPDGGEVALEPCSNPQRECFHQY